MIKYSFKTRTKKQIINKMQLLTIIFNFYTMNNYKFYN